MRLSLSNFRSWMGLERKLAPSTVLLYGNYARALLRDQDSAVALLHDPERFVARAAEYDAQLCSTSRCGFRSSLRMFAQYIEAREGVHINFVFPRERDTIRPVSILGPPLRDFQEHLIPFSRLEFIRWRDVTRSGSKGCLTDVAYGHSTSLAPCTRYLALYRRELDHVRPLCLYIPDGGKDITIDHPRYEFLLEQRGDHVVCTLLDQMRPPQSFRVVYGGLGDGLEHAPLVFHVAIYGEPLGDLFHRLYVKTHDLDRRLKSTELDAPRLATARFAIVPREQHRYFNHMAECPVNCRCALTFAFSRHILQQVTPLLPKG